MQTPNYFILGAPKCGTTALAQYLSYHPDVFLSSPKEPHFFDAQYAQGIPYYIQHYYKHWHTEPAAGEATPSYFAVPYVAERIKSATPDAKLIIILRDPVTRAFSSWWMLHARGMEPLNFTDAIALEAQQLQEIHPLDSATAETDWIEHVRRIRAGKPIEIRTYLYHGHYDIHLKRYRDIFPENQIKVVFSHQLHQNPAQVVRELWHFIGVDNQAALPSFERVNEALGAGVQPLMKLLQATGLMHLRNHLPARTKSWIKSRLSGIGKQPEMDPQSRMRLLEHFEPHTRELERLLDEDLSAWRKIV